jgi:hypothetical protein
LAVLLQLAERVGVALRLHGCGCRGVEADVEDGVVSRGG